MVYISPARFVHFSLLSTVSVFSVISFNNVGTIPKIRSFFFLFFHGAFWVGGGKGWEREIDGGLSLGLGRDEVIGRGWGWGWFFPLPLLLLLFSGLFSYQRCVLHFFYKEILFARGLCLGTGVGGMGGSGLRWGRRRGGSDS